jgi:hypothetical protein
VTKVVSEKLLRDLQEGVYDSDLFAIESFVMRRSHALRLKRSVKDYQVGEKVVVNRLCGSSVFHDKVGSVVGIEKTKLRVNIDSTEYSMVPVLLDKLLA